MIRDITLWLGTLALLAASTGCPTADDDDAGARIDLEGVVIDRNLDDAPVADAWIVLDTGDELITARSGGDGSFLIPEVPSSAPVTLTVAGEERRATTYLGRILADEELPLELGCEYRETSYYDLPMILISGTFTGAPQGSYVIFSGEGVLSYDYIPVESTAPTAFQFEAEIGAGDAEYFFVGLAFDGTTGEALAAAAVTVDVADEVDVDVELTHDDPTAMTVSASQPLLDGEPLTALDETYTSSLGMVYAGEGFGGFVGWTRGWTATDDGFDLDVSYVPIDDHPARINVYLAEDLSTAGAFAYGSIPFEPGATELDLELMDSPVLDGGGDFGPGGTVAWEPIEGATDYLLYALDGDVLAWWFLADSPTFTFPRMPDDFDTSIILDDSADWTARAYQRTEDAEGGTDTTQPYLVSETPGGEISF
jgi:hypothetical protein